MPQVHHYSAESVMKLSVKDEISRTNSKQIHRLSIASLQLDAGVEAMAGAGERRRSSKGLTVAFGGVDRDGAGPVNADRGALSTPLLQGDAHPKGSQT